MSVPAAYLGVIIIWSTTPLAIKWSGQDVGFLFGVTSRMAFGAVLALAIVRLLRIELPWHPEARRTYAAAALGIYGAMLSVYWAAQHIPSGLISVIFGLSPLITGALASLSLGEPSLTPRRVLGMVLGIIGLMVIFATEQSELEHALSGAGAVLVAVILHSVSGVLVKRIGAAINPFATTTGSLLIAASLFAATWIVFDGAVPRQISGRTAVSIAYLGLFGSVVGFSLYFFALKRLSVAVMSLVTLITPVCALLLGQWLNNEAVPWEIWLGTSIILTGLAFYIWDSKAASRRAAALLE